MRLLGIYREAECSPGRHRSNDALLLEQVACALRMHGFSVDLMAMEQAAEARRDASLVFSMCQGRASLDALASWEDEGTRIVNSPRAARRTYREELPGVLRAAGVAFPDTTVVPTTTAGARGVTVNGGLWLKRGGVHASVSADVQWIDSADGLRAGLQEFASRGITQAAVQIHQDGAEIKFYGVAGGRFFHWFYPNSVTPAYAVDPQALEAMAASAAAAAGLDIYGGDVIVSPSGTVTLIDLNDWPSFAPCREAAAAAIASYLMGRIDGAWNPRLVSSAKQGAL